jgi:Protein of unknown function (DUF4241)
MTIIIKYALIAFIFLSCTNVPEKKEGPKPSSEPLDTVKLVPAKIAAKPMLFETAFIKGTKQELNNYTFDLYGVNIGKLKVPSGRIVACDPLHIEEYGKPFTQTFPKGEFPVQLAIGYLDGEEISAFARILFSNEPVEKWEFALLEGQSPLPVGGNKMHGFGVDAGIGIFLDEEAVKAFDLSKTEDMYREVLKKMTEHYRVRWRHAMYDFGNHNLAAFSTGVGDGRYATYIGFDAKGQPCRLVTDFQIFDWREK